MLLRALICIHVRVCVCVHLTANQETIVELASFFKRAVPSDLFPNAVAHGDKNTPTDSSSEDSQVVRMHPNIQCSTATCNNIADIALIIFAAVGTANITDMALLVQLSIDVDVTWHCIIVLRSC